MIKCAHWSTVSMHNNQQKNQFQAAVVSINRFHVVQLDANDF